MLIGVAIEIPFAIGEMLLGLEVRISTLDLGKGSLTIIICTDYCNSRK